MFLTYFAIQSKPLKLVFAMVNTEVWFDWIWNQLRDMPLCGPVRAFPGRKG